MNETNQKITKTNAMNSIINYWSELRQCVDHVDYALNSDPELDDLPFLAKSLQPLIGLLETPPYIVGKTSRELLSSYAKSCTEVSRMLGDVERVDFVEGAKLQNQIHEQLTSTLENITQRTDRVLSLAKESEKNSDRALLDSLREQTNDLSARHRILQQELSQLTTDKIALEEAAQRDAVDHQKEISQLEERLSADFQKKIEDKTNTYVEVALKALEENRTSFAATGLYWSIAAVVIFCMGIGLSIYLAIYGGNELKANPNLQWSLLAFYSVKGIILLGLLYAVVSYCVKQSRSFMHESLKSAERTHAISYGKFYLLAFGAGSANENVKEAFAHWNISTSSAFSSDPMSNRESEPLQAKFLENLVGKIIDKASSAKN